MSILRETHPNWQFDPWEEYGELRDILAEAKREGYIEEISVMEKRTKLRPENWYRDKGSGEIYSLVAPDFPARGSWLEVDIEDLKRTEHPIQ